MKKQIKITLLLFLPIFLNAQDNNSLSLFEFHSPFEREVFYGDTNNFLLMALASAKKVSDESVVKYYSDIFKEKISGIDKEKILKKPPKAQCKMLYKEVHGAFLKRYSETASFTDLLGKGEYNCVTASILFAIVFEDYGIPYIGKELPTHVFLLAYPQTESILIETTNPAKGWISYDDNYKRQYLEHLISNKIILPTDLDSRPISELFNECHFNNSALNFKEILALQYHNHGIDNLNKKQFLKAFEDFEKSYFLYSSERNKYLLLVSLVPAFEEIKMQTPEDIDILYKAFMYLEHENKPQLIADSFYEIMQQLIFNRDEMPLLDSMHARLISLIDDTVTIHKINYAYNFEKCRKLLLTSGKHETLPFAKAAVLLRPESTDAHNLLYHAIINDYQFKPKNQAIDTIHGLLTSMPELKEFKNIPNLFFNLQLEYASELYRDGKFTQGEKALSGFEKDYALWNPEGIDPNLVGRAYSEAAVAHFRKGSLSKAKATIERGLIYAPGSYELRNRLYQLTQ